jgi:hypothetical protein
MRREKVEILLIPAIRDGLQGSFAKSNCKMWVRIRASAVGSSHLKLDRRPSRSTSTVARSDSRGDFMVAVTAEGS